MKPLASDLRIITALPAEAKPINRHFGLERDNRITQYPLYRTEGIMLIISGVGQADVATAACWLQSQYPINERTRWLNIGIGGHIYRHLGEIIIASQVCNENLECYDIPTSEPSPCDSQQVMTVEQPLSHYPGDWVYDMEAYGFIKALSGSIASGSVQCMKIISDNQDNPVTNISGKMVSKLISEQLETIDKLVQQWGISH